MSLPAAFSYKGNPTITSWIWSRWLLLPQGLRTSVYKTVVRFFGISEDRNHVFRLPFGLYAKLCPTPDEGLVTAYVREKTTIPVPTVLDHIRVGFRGDRPWFMLMTAVPGTLLHSEKESRLSSITDEQKALIRDTLADWISQLRSLSPPHPQKVSGFLGGSFKSYRIEDCKPVGPFISPADFHAQPFCAAYPDYPDEADDRVKRLIAERPQKSYNIYLVHGDILPHNILADEAYHLTGLIDWECAAWMPEYWETAASTRTWWWRAWAWKDIVKGFPQYDDDLALEYRIQMWYVST